MANDDEIVGWRETPWMAWMAESDAISCYLASAIRLIEGPHSQVQGPAILALLAAGTERLTKFTIGAIELAQGNDWPGGKLRGMNHSIIKLDTHARSLIAERTNLSTARGLLVQLRAELDADPLWPPLLHAVDDWANGGRYWGFDVLTQKQRRPAPSTELWSRAIGEALTMGDLQAFSQGSPTIQAEVDARVASCIERWWEYYARSWITGVCGPDGQQWSSAISPRAALRAIPSNKG